MPLSRKKSCAPCRESKARCNRTVPECSRCALRHLTCVYDGRDAYRPAAACQPRSTALLPLATTQQEEQTLIGPEADILDSWGALMENAGLVATQDLNLAEPREGFGAQLCPWPEKNGLPLIPGCLSTPNDPWALLQQTEEDTSATVMQRADPSIPSRNSHAAGRDTGHSNHTLLKKTMFRTCIMCTILLGQVTSFPKLLVEGDRLPPFIHAPCHTDDGGGGGGIQALECSERGSHQCLPRELAVCAGLVEMFYARTRGNADHVWEAVYRERARLQEGWADFTSMQRLAALQSATVLLLLQASDSTTVETNDSGLLLNTVLSFAANITQTHEWRSEPRGGAAMDRREWVFRESIRRVMALLHIVEALLDGFVYSAGATSDDPSSGSEAGFRGVPLPSGRELWEARTGRAWARSYRQHLADQSSDKVLTVGDALDSGGVGETVGARANPAGAARLSEVMRWAEGLDSLGMLVWMVLPFEDALARHRQGVA